MKDINAKTVLDEETSQFYYEGLADYTKYKESNVAHYLDELSRPNLLINGGFQISQRGTTFNYSGKSTTMYTFDRWAITGDNAQTYSIVDGLMQIDTLSGKRTSFRQKVELNSNLIRIIKEHNHKLTMSIRIDTTISHIATAYVGDEAYNYELKIGKNVINHTFIVTNELLAVGYLEVVIYYVNNQDNNVSVIPIWAKLELGSIATPFYPRNYVDELMMCKRYYELVLLMSNKNEFLSKTTGLLGVSASCQEKRINKPIITSYDSDSHPNKCSRFIAGVSTIPGQPVRISFDNQYGWVEIQSDTGSSANGVLAYLKIDAEIY